MVGDTKLYNISPVYLTGSSSHQESFFAFIGGMPMPARLLLIPETNNCPTENAKKQHNTKITACFKISMETGDMTNVFEISHTACIIKVRRLTMAEKVESRHIFEIRRLILY